MAGVDMDDVTIEEHRRRLEVDGYTVVENVIEPSLIDAIGDDVARLEQELGIEPSQNLFEGLATKRIYNLLVHGKTFEQVPVHHEVLPVVEAVLDKGLLVSSLSSIDILAGEKAQMLHADDQVIGLQRPHQQIICNTMWAITDFTEANGATRLVPGSHTADHIPDLKKTYDTIPAEMAKGSVLVWVGSLWHGGGANTTTTSRVGLAMNYCAGFIRQQENQQLGIPLPVARGFDPRLRELVGYSVYRGLIGHIDKAHPAKVILEADANANLLWELAKP